MGSSGDILDWRPPTWTTNIISTGPSYKTLAMMKEYLKLLASGEAPHLVKPEESVYSYTATTINWGKAVESAPFFTPEPKEPPVPVMPEQLT
jgi:hypothetical protein